MRITRSTSAVTLGALLLATLAACGGTPAAPPAAPVATTAPAAPAATTAPAAPAATTAPAAGEKTKVTFMTWEGADTNAAIDAAIAKFEADNPTIDVERVPSPNSGYGDKLTTMVQSKTLPDIFWAGNDTAQQLGAEGVLYDWTTLAKGATTDAFKLGQFAPGAIENWTSADGKLYGLPTLMNTYGLWYNADLFKAANVPLPKPGWTYDEMLAAAKALTVKNGETVSRYGVYSPGDEGLASPFTISNCAVSAGGKPFMDKIINPTVVTADAAYVDCAKKMAAAIQAGNITPPGYPGDGLTESFIAGQVPMMFFGQWLAPSFLESKPSFQYGFAPLPISKDVVQAYDAVGIASPATIKNPEATWKVMEFLASRAWETVLVGAPVAPAAHVPSSTPYFTKLTESNLGGAADSIKYMLEAPTKQGIRFTAPWSAKARDVLKANWSDIMTGKQPIDTALPKMVTDLNAIIKAG